MLLDDIRMIIEIVDGVVFGVPDVAYKGVYVFNVIRDFIWWDAYNSPSHKVNQTSYWMVLE